MNNQKTVWTVVIVVVVLILIGVGIWAAKDKDEYVSTTGTDQATTTMDTSTDDGTGVEVGATTSGMSYSQALKTYLNKRIQFSTPPGLDSCQASPSTLTFKGGTKFMLDNRMAKSATIRLGADVSYVLPAHSFQVVSLATPATYRVDCNASTNIVTLQIQK